MLVSALVSGIVLGSIYALIGAGLNLIFGVVKVINFAQGALLMFGVYLVYWTVTLTGFDPYLSLPIVVIVMAALGYLIQSAIINPVLKKERTSQLLITFGLGMFIENMVLATMGPDVRRVRTVFRGNSIAIGDVRVAYESIALIVVTAACIGLLFLYLNRTKIGTAIRAVAQQPDSAELAGINVKRIYGVAFGIGMAMTGVAAVLMAPLYDVHPTMGESFGIMAFVVVVLGGLGNVQGAAVAGLLLGVLQNLFAMFVSFQLSLAFVFFVFILILLFRPQGLFGRAARVA
ncbi:branched-chain amino acid ABC transporter permease [Agrococcus sediminis]|uniref:branched-chain amino acid ABC transporter permease n=1 Tax=Agrococcus sediminis TaxID=2599924 RepID=UPI00381D4F6D